MAGLAVTYGLNLNARLSRWILSFCKLENKIISIERIYQYSQIPSEAPILIEDSRPPSTWPENGTIELTELKVVIGLRYCRSFVRVLRVVFLWFKTYVIVIVSVNSYYLLSYCWNIIAFPHFIGNHSGLA